MKHLNLYITYDKSITLYLLFILLLFPIFHSKNNSFASIVLYTQNEGI